MSEPKVHYIVKIDRRETRSVQVKTRQCVEERPTELKDDNYGRKEVVYERKYEMVDGIEQRQSQEEVFRQVVKEEDFKLAAVIAAINGFEKP